MSERPADSDLPCPVAVPPASVGGLFGSLPASVGGLFGAAGAATAVTGRVGAGVGDGALSASPPAGLDGAVGCATETGAGCGAGAGCDPGAGPAT
jgi:hypothetical protein